MPWGQRTFLMGILNLTPDSFYDGGKFQAAPSALKQAQFLQTHGADIIDIGAESTRPQAKNIEAKEEIRRLSPLFENIKENIELPLSLDTYKSEVARWGLERGVVLINDTRGLQGDLKMADTIAEKAGHVIITHYLNAPARANDIIDDILRFFEHSLTLAEKAGIAQEHIILDPGLGFGKSYRQNMEIIRKSSQLKSLGLPLLLGASRKSFIGITLDLKVEDRLEGSLAATAIAIEQGVDLVRAHEMREHQRVAQFCDAIYRT